MVPRHILDDESSVSVLTWLEYATLATTTTLYPMWSLYLYLTLTLFAPSFFTSFARSQQLHRSYPRHLQRPQELEEAGAFIQQAPRFGSSILRFEKSGLIVVDISNNKLRGTLPWFMVWMPLLLALSLENKMLSGMMPRKKKEEKKRRRNNKKRKKKKKKEEEISFADGSKNVTVK
ncbi:hypothetical protein Ahy_A01g003566 [Arachis hypogaea]|uniref:Uncharacterized protein n=1 Tax=Arachis hypogaea TaxID=3818 RepID=A0A445ETQ6_ARAHY|nr:hypothetical protein Ahy_A01g003566 [Arachis hypogaea]